MSEEFVPVSVDVDDAIEHIDLSRLSEDQRHRLEASGLPGSRDMFNRENPALARAALREFADCFLPQIRRAQ